MKESLLQLQLSALIYDYTVFEDFELINLTVKISNKIIDEILYILI